ncbi:MAG: hypothetical protein Kapaf2KO_15360 [Candidatus Kapaibacteriales bacterium]
MKYFILFIILFCILEDSIAQERGAQPGGEPVTPQPPKRDTTIIFEPARPLEIYTGDQSLYPHHLGPHFVFSVHGFGFGGYYNYSLNEDFTLSLKLFGSSAFNGDELEQFNPSSGIFEVRNKINRVYSVPLDISLRYFFTGNKLESSFRPFVSAGVTPFMVLTTPYRVGRDPNGQVVDFFSALGDIESYYKIGGGGGIGANWGSNPKNDYRAEVSYYYLPFGGDGIESIIDRSIDNLGGLFLSVSLGFDL